MSQNALPAREMQIAAAKKPIPGHQLKRSLSGAQIQTQAKKATTTASAARTSAAANSATENRVANSGNNVASRSNIPTPHAPEVTRSVAPQAAPAPNGDNRMDIAHDGPNQADPQPGPSQHQLTDEKRYTVAVRNSFGIFSDDEDADVSDAESTSGRESSSEEEDATASERVRMPPIVVHATKIKDYGAFRRRVAKTCKQEFRIVYRPSAITIYTHTREDHANLFADLRNGQIQAHSHPLKKDKLLTYILKDLPQGLSFEEVVEDLDKLVQPVKVLPLNKRRVDFDEDLFPYYIVYLPATYDVRKLIKIRTVLNFRVRWDKMNTHNRTTQCHRCQQFGHGAGYCTYIPRCVKCIGEHLSNECPISAADTGEVEVQCTNCKGAHPASYRNCPAHHSYLDKIHKIQDSRRRPNTRAMIEFPHELSLARLRFKPVDPMRKRPPRSQANTYRQHWQHRIRINHRLAPWPVPPTYIYFNLYQLNSTHLILCATCRKCCKWCAKLTTA